MCTQQRGEYISTATLDSLVCHFRFAWSKPAAPDSLREILLLYVNGALTLFARTLAGLAISSTVKYEQASRRRKFTGASSCSEVALEPTCNMQTKGEVPLVRRI